MSINLAISRILIQKSFMAGDAAHLVKPEERERDPKLDSQHQINQLWWCMPIILTL